MPSSLRRCARARCALFAASLALCGVAGCAETPSAEVIETATDSEDSPTATDAEGTDTAANPGTANNTEDPTAAPQGNAGANTEAPNSGGAGNAPASASTPAGGSNGGGSPSVGGASSSGTSTGGAGSSAAASAGAGGNAAVTCDASPAAASEGFVHPGGLHKRSDLERMRYMVEAGRDPWFSSFQTLSAHPNAQYDYVVRGNPTWTVVHREGEHRGEFEQDATAAYLNALMWAITLDERHAQKCIEIFAAWSNLTEVTGGGTEALNAGLFAWKLVEAAELIKSTYDGWASAEREAFEAMLVYPGYSSSELPATLSDSNGTFYWRIYNGDPGRHGNQDMIAWRAMISMGVLLDNRVMFERALRYFKGEPHRADDLPYAPGPGVPGAQLEDNDYFTTYQATRDTTVADYGYNGVLEHYFWENGQSQESSRDQQHAFFGLGIAAGIAEVAWNQGDSVWNALDQRLLKAFEFSARYNASYIAPFPDQPAPWEPLPSEVVQRSDRTGRWFSKAINPYFENNFVEVSRGDFPGKRPVFEQALAHFQVRMGVNPEQTLWTERARDVAIEQAGYEEVGFNLDHAGFGGLTFRRPPGCAGDPIAGFSNGLPNFALPVLPGEVLAAHYDHFPGSGEGRTYHDLSSGNSGASYRSDDVDIVCGASGTFLVSDLEVGEWLSYTVYVPSSGSYDVDVVYSALAEGAGVAVSFGGMDVSAEVILPSTALPGASMPSVDRARVASGVPLDAGVQALRVTVGGAPQAFELAAIRVSQP